MSLMILLPPVSPVPATMIWCPVTVWSQRRAATSAMV